MDDATISWAIPTKARLATKAGVNSRACLIQNFPKFLTQSQLRMITY
ncbi:hypothetical protein [Moraxella lacunata]